jgi:uncharacterized protein
MKKIIFTLMMLLFAACLQAQNIAGTWYGTLQVQGSKLRIVFHITKSGDGYQTTMDSPDQGASGLSTDNTTVTGNQVIIGAAKLGMTYTGSYMSDSNIIKGVFKQGTVSIPLSLTTTETKVGKVEPAVRPQDPTDFPYRREEVSFTNKVAGNMLAGTLTMPENGKASKIVVLITGSGPQNRNEEIVQFNHRPFLVWSDWLTRNGIAVLRFDDRGVGASNGDYATATSADFAGDVEAAVSYIQSRDDLKGLSIGLMGHSEGGMIAPMVASRSKAVKFVVLLAAPGLPVSQLMLQQTQDQMRLDGAPDSVITSSVALSKKLFAAMNENKDMPADELKTKLAGMIHGEISNLPASALGGASVDDVVRSSLSKLNSPWFRYFITFDPAVYLTQTKCPVLALNGTLDMQVRSTANLAAIKECLQKGGNKNVEIMPLDNLNHLFQKAGTGSVEEYSQISETVNPVALQKVAGWINKL